MSSHRRIDEESFGNQSEHKDILIDDEREAGQDLRLIRLFNHYRHDWMNEIQLIFGYIKLRKYEKLESLIETIKVKVQQESNISKLGVPELIVYLFSVQAEVKELKLVLEMEHEIHLNEVLRDDKELGQLVIAVIESFKQHAVIHNENVHGLFVELIQAAGELQVNFEYECDQTGDQLLPAVEQVLLQSKASINWKTNQWDGYSIGVCIVIPLNI